MVTALSASHDRVSLEVRERLAVAVDDTPALLRKLYRHLGPCVILATCNRFEVYLAADVSAERALAVLQREGGIDLAAVGPGLEVLRDGDAARHLFRVAGGLESMVTGEHEILGQARRAYTMAVDADTSSHVLARLFHGAVRAGRRVRTETAIGAGARSVARLAAEQAAIARPDLAAARVLVVGAGEAGRQAAFALRDRGATNFTIANRTIERGAALAADLGGRALPLEDLAEAVAQTDIVVAAVASPAAVLRREHFSQVVAEGGSLLVFDLGMPRNVDPTAAALSCLQYSDLDDLQALAVERVRARDDARPQAEAIIEAELTRFVEWLDQRDATAAIAHLVDRAERVRRAQVERTARALSADEGQRAQLEAMSRALVKQLLHPAISSARRTDPTGDSVRALRSLFQLDGSPGG